MNDPFSPERKTVWLRKQNLFGSGYAGLGGQVRCGLARKPRCRDRQGIIMISIAGDLAVALTLKRDFDWHLLDEADKSVLMEYRPVLGDGDLEDYVRLITQETAALRSRQLRSKPGSSADLAPVGVGECTCSGSRPTRCWACAREGGNIGHFSLIPTESAPSRNSFHRLFFRR